MAGVEDRPEPPRLTEGFLGPQVKFQSYGLSVPSHPDPIIYMDSGIVEIKVAMDERVRMTHKLLSVERKKDVTEFCLVQWLPDGFLYVVSPPERGWYKLQLYGLPSGVAGPNFQGVFNYVIFCPGLMAQVWPFPKQYPMWKDGGFLFEPLSLPRGIKDNGVVFRVRVPRAREVVLKLHESWMKMEKGQEADIYEAVVNFGELACPPGAKIKLNVKFGGKDFNTLLEYTI